MKGDAPKNPFLFDRQVNVIIGSFFLLLLFLFLPRKPPIASSSSSSSCSLQLVEYFRQKVVRLLVNHRTLQHFKPRRKEHAN